ncbi:helix-turn-helix domain-containing protein [Apilactobacillus micheneri]|uniref:helix-turn-helix domain-containing protein n=1 Tax=Apilactobacillus micheneri TaxID=1899430 RepID=UPI00112E075F|nr:helix-turn-helix transcriptional regulator [Apilactobacillus micheneri]TPR38589.1 XRE family transcriptional regulator [Apilactobacillus micheneri]
MIRNKLSELLAERNLKISRVANDIPDLSRNTINSVANNKTKMIQMDTVNLLCQYLAVEPKNFFEFLPFDISNSTFISDDTYYVDSKNADVKIIDNFSLDSYIMKKSISEDRPYTSETFEFTIMTDSHYTPIPLLDIVDGSSHFSREKENIFDPKSDMKFPLHFSVLAKDEEQEEKFKKEVLNRMSPGFKSAMKDMIREKFVKSIQQYFEENLPSKVDYSSINIKLEFDFSDQDNLIQKNNDSVFKEQFYTDFPS